MRKTAGFTLIELVIVIVILGILGAVAAPKFLNLQGDAYGANINALKSSLQSSMTMASTKAVLDGKDGDGSTTPITGVTGYSGVEFSFGYPKANEGVTGIIGTLQDFDFNSYDVNTVSGASAILIKPSARVNSDCSVTYTEAADKDTPATLAYTTTGC